MIVKACGLRRQEDAELAVELGADLLGFVYEPSSPRFVGSSDWAPGWLVVLDVPRVAVFGPVALPPPPAMTHVQAHTWPADWSDPRPRLSVTRLGSPEGDLALSKPGEILLLDAFDPHHHGGAGRQVDWDRAAEIVAASSVPVILAGGLTPENVAEAIKRVRPVGVDVSSGIEKAPGIKDPERLKRFIAEAKGAL